MNIAKYGVVMEGNVWQRKVRSSKENQHEMKDIKYEYRVRLGKALSGAESAVTQS